MDFERGTPLLPRMTLMAKDLVDQIAARAMVPVVSHRFKTC
jgi:hypothetical protein